MRRTIIAFLLCLVVLAIAERARADTYKSKHHNYRVETVFEGFERPWSLAFLPDGRILVTEKGGRLNLLNPANGSRATVGGVPRVVTIGQGGLLDVALHPDFRNNRLVYLSYSAAGDGGHTTHVGRGQLEGNELRKFQVLFVAAPFGGAGQHFGSRLVFDRDGYLFITVGDRGQRHSAQKLDNYHGKLVRLTADGKPPPDNPFVKRAGALPGIWTYGHRNAQGLTLHPETGVLWLHEHGPRGGDELNLPKPGRNYGWPEATFGREYFGPRIGKEPPVAGTEPPIHHWTPSIAPSGMAFYDGKTFPRWQGDLFVGALVQRKLVRLRLKGERVIEEENLLQELGWRIRDVRVGPDGHLYVLPDESNTRMIRLVPMN